MGTPRASQACTGFALGRDGPVRLKNYWLADKELNSNRKP